jgi:predicted porin
MRKLLLGTTAVVGAALIGATGASAQEAPTVRIGGYFDFSLGYVNDNADRNLPPAGTATRGAGLSRWDFRADTEIHVLVQGKAANGLTYGARIEFEMDSIGVGSAGTAFNTDEMWMFVSSPTLGTLRFGDTDSAAGVMQVRPPRYVGFNGLRVNWVRTGGTRYMFAGLNDGADNTKIVYLSPQFAGFDFGVSFALNGGEGEREVRGQSTPVSLTGTVIAAPGLQRGRIDRENEFTGAIRYRGTFGAVGVAAGFGFTTATAPSNRVATAAPNIGLEEALATRTQNPTAYSVGLSVSFSGLTLGGEYTWGRYTGSSPGNAGPAAGRGDSRHWLLGAAYTFEGITLTANFGRGTQDTNTATYGDQSSRIIGLGVSYALAPGWSLYAYYENIRDNNYPSAIGSLLAGARRSTDGLVIGTSLTF